MTYWLMKMTLICCIALPTTGPAEARRARPPRHSSATFASVDDLVRTVSCSVAQFAVDAQRAGQPVKSIKGQVTVKLSNALSRSTGASADLPLIPISASLGATGARMGSVTKTWDVGLVPGQPVPSVCGTRTVRVFDARGASAGVAQIEPLFTVRDLVQPSPTGCVNTTTISIADGFSVERKASVGLKIDLKIVKISLGAGEAAATRETSYAIEFNFGAPRRNRCGFLRPGRG